jgi:AmmeMemoRadiSam system protein A
MPRLDRVQGEILLKTARTAISRYLQQGRKWVPALDDCDGPLKASRACFVTLQRDGQLRGCIGSLEAHEPLILNVAHNAWSAAFADPRFPPVSASELNELHIDVSVLGLPEAIHFDSDIHLIEQLRPGVDGLILYTPQGSRATFLPSVWEQLPNPLHFLQHLKQKAGLAPDFWHPALRAERYEVQYFEESPQT